nr:hypothetical protein [Pseudomonas sp. CC6-YY-74]
MTIRFKLIAAFIAVTLIPVLIITLFVTRQAMDRERTLFNQSSVKQIQEVDNAFSFFLESAAENVTLLTQTRLLKSSDSSLPSYMEASQATKMSPLPVGLALRSMSCSSSLANRTPVTPMCMRLQARGIICNGPCLKFAPTTIRANDLGSRPR